MASDALGNTANASTSEASATPPPPAARRSIPAPTASTTHAKMARIAWDRYQMG